MPDATRRMVAESPEPMKLARLLMGEVWRAPSGGPGLWFHEGAFWEWFGGRWRKKTVDDVARSLWRLLEDVVYVVEGRQGEREVRVAPTKIVVGNVVEALASVSEFPRSRLLGWLGEEADRRPPAEKCVAFEDVVVYVKPGGFVTIPRDDRFVDPVVVPCQWDEEATCPTWLRCVDEWGSGSGEWARLLRRWMGYCLLPDKTYARWLMLHGLIRGGKGTICDIITTLMGKDAVYGTTFESMGSRFGIGGIQHARVVQVRESSSPGRDAAEAAVRVLKNIIGMDPQPIDEKFRNIERNVVVQASVMVASNYIPKLPNKGDGLAGKLVVLPFTVSFKDREDLGLGEKLKKEIAGIARWAMQGAMELEESLPGERWPVLKEAEPAWRQWRLENNPMDAFLEARFVKDPRGFVTGELLKREWKDFVRENSIPPKMQPALNQLSYLLERDGSWGLVRDRLRGADGLPGRRGVRGLTLKKVREDDT